MKIIVLVKQVPNPQRIARLREDGTLDRERAVSIINPCDRNAVEAALQIREKIGGSITAISMGPPKAEDALREALAMGVDEAILLCDRKLAGSDTLATSYALAKAIEKVRCYDLIICGVEASDGNTGQVGPEIAERLGIHQATYAQRLEINGDSIEISRVFENGYVRLKIALPALVTVNGTANQPRNTTFAGIIGAMRKPVQLWSATQIGADERRVGIAGSPTKIKSVHKALAERSRQLIDGGTADAVVEKLLTRLIRDNVELVDPDGKRI